jgi:hypothetical protein
MTQTTEVGMSKLGAFEEDEAQMTLREADDLERHGHDVSAIRTLVGMARQADRGGWDTLKLAMLAVDVIVDNDKR